MLLLEAQLSESGRPILQPGEIECQLIDSTDIDIEQETKPPYWNPLLGGIVSLTTHRVIWIERTRKKEPVKPRALAIPHPAVQSLEPLRKGGLKSLFGKQAVKLRLVVGIQKDAVVAARGPADVASGVRVVMVFRNLDSNSDAFVTRFQVRDTEVSTHYLARRQLSFVPLWCSVSGAYFVLFLKLQCQKGWPWHLSFCGYRPECFYFSAAIRDALTGYRVSTK